MNEKGRSWPIFKKTHLNRRINFARLTKENFFPEISGIGGVHAEDRVPAEGRRLRQDWQVKIRLDLSTASYLT